MSFYLQVLHFKNITPEQIERAKKIMEDHKKEFEYLAKK